jgi:hypothetical protein
MNCYDAILKKDISLLGQAMKDSFLVWSEMLPYTIPSWVMKEMEQKIFTFYSGAITSGSGGGYIIVPSENAVQGALRVSVRWE